MSLSQVKHNFSLDELSKIRQFLDTNPGMFQAVTGKQPPGRRKGTKNAGIDEGTIIEVAEPIVENVIEITPEQAKKMTKQKRKPRNLTDEQKEKMREALARGRAILAERRANSKPEPIELPEPKPKVIKKKELPADYVGDVQTKRYVVKAKPVKSKPIAIKKKVVKRDETDTEEDTSDDELPLETTESESEGTILRKITKKTKALKKVNDILEKQPIQPKYDIFRRR
jgi:hypothetical protein